jgi:hypothetical protein
LKCGAGEGGGDSWTDRVKNKVLHRVKEERNIVHTVGRRKANWIGHILCRNCLLKHFIEEKVQGRGRYSKLEEAALDRTHWRTPFGRRNVSVVRQTVR